MGNFKLTTTYYINSTIILIELFDKTHLSNI